MYSFSSPGAGNVDETNLRLLIESMDDPVWLVDASCNIMQCNGAFREWVSHFIGKPLGPGDNILNNGEDKLYFHKFDMCYRLALGGKTFKTVEDQLIKGITHYTSVSFKPLIDDNGKVVAVSCFARDITEQRKHLFHIERQNSTLREIAFIESHKIRGPVATILGLEQFFNYKDLSDPVNREIMEGVKTVTLELDSFIREVVRLSNEIDRKNAQDASEGSAQ
jgi:hypothetical protein